MRPRHVCLLLALGEVGCASSTRSTPPADGGVADSSQVVDSGPAADASDGGLADANGADADGADANGTDASDGGAADAATPASGDAGPPPPDQPIGVDMPDLLRMYVGLSPSGPSEARTEMDKARARGFTHARFEGGQFWPAELMGPNG